MAVMLKTADVLNCNAGDMMNFIKNENASTDNPSLDLKRMTKSFFVGYKIFNYYYRVVWYTSL